MMLKYSFGQDQAAMAIENAVADVLSSGIHTRDIALDKNLAIGTSQMGDAIAGRIAVSRQKPANLSTGSIHNV
jgi:3-isopropylmalate dehydrogenase